MPLSTPITFMQSGPCDSSPCGLAEEVFFEMQNDQLILNDELMFFQPLENPDVYETPQENKVRSISSPHYGPIEKQFTTQTVEEIIKLYQEAPSIKQTEESAKEHILPLSFPQINYFIEIQHGNALIGFCFESFTFPEAPMCSETQQSFVDEKGN